ncbi:MAG TPA: hypothetical protein VK445_05820 [Dissulfurispiraceae bacterium]|nr:hypothetical protein [Dissulfurispiraceae bacterium]
MKKILALVLAFFVICSVGCSSKAVKQPSADSKTATEAFALAEKIRDAYAQRDMSAMRAYTTPEGFKTISESMKNFDSVQLEFKPLLVDIRESGTHLYVSWTGIWQARGQRFEERGLVVFGLKGSPFRVDEVLRANPFRYPEF